MRASVEPTIIPSRQGAATQGTLPTATLLCPIAPSSRRDNRKSASTAVAGTPPHKIIRPGGEICDWNLPHPGQAHSLTRSSTTLSHPVGEGQRIVRRLAKRRWTGVAGRSSATRPACDGCSFSPGEKVRMRASVQPSSNAFHGFNGRSKGRSNLRLMPALAGSVKGNSPSAACWS
jgi:hypothetical protein